MNVNVFVVSEISVRQAFLTPDRKQTTGNEFKKKTSRYHHYLSSFEISGKSTQPSRRNSVDKKKGGGRTKKRKNTTITIRSSEQELRAKTRLTINTRRKWYKFYTLLERYLEYLKRNLERDLECNLKRDF